MESATVISIRKTVFHVEFAFKILLFNIDFRNCIFPDLP